MRKQQKVAYTKLCEDLPLFHQVCRNAKLTTKLVAFRYNVAWKLASNAKRNSVYSLWMTSFPHKRLTGSRRPMHLLYKQCPAFPILSYITDERVARW